jgi:hypothetical protein
MQRHKVQEPEDSCENSFGKELLLVSQVEFLRGLPQVFPTHPVYRINPGKLIFVKAGRYDAEA